MKTILLILLCISAVTATIANDAEPVTKVSSSFQFDGIVTAGEWDNITEVDLTVQTPVYHGEPTELTQIKLGYDENYIYLSGALFDSEPHKILANNKQRDGGSPSTDWFGMVIDSYNDNQNALGFFTTPTGSRFDASISGDGNGRNPMNVSWNNFWDVKVHRSDKGWDVEMRVPFSSLQYQVIDGKVTMGITIWRYIARKNEMHISPDISPDLGEMGIWRPSKSKEYIFDGVKQKKPFYITPYVLAGASNINELNDAETSYVNEKDFKREIGLDVKYGLTNNFTLDLTVNTDFAQVEVDDQQVNLSRFSLFFPEKRLFFQERSGIFDFGMGSRNNLFYSRRIGIDDSNNAIPILGGARVTGRAGDWDIGIISMQTKGTTDFLSNNYSVLRFKKRILDAYSDVGFLLTNNIDVDGNYNTVYGFDSSIRVGNDVFLSLKFAQSFTKGFNSKILSADPSAFWISLSKRSNKDFSYGFSLSRIGEEFDSKIGFFDRDNYMRVGSRMQYNFYSGKDSKLFTHGPTLRGVSYLENVNNTLNNMFYGLGYEWTWKNGMQVELGGRLRYDDITSEFDLADVVIIPIDSYLYPSFQVEYSSPQNIPYVITSEISYGSFYDGTNTSVNLSPVFNVSSNLELSGTYEYNKVRFNSRDQGFNVHLGRLKALYMFSTKFSISSFVQYNSLDKLYLANVRARFNPKEGNDLFLVFNSDFNDNRDAEFLQLPFSNQSSFLVKYSYTFVK